jgi:hypothetical protein
VQAATGLRECETGEEKSESREVWADQSADVLSIVCGARGWAEV